MRKSIPVLILVVTIAMFSCNKQPSKIPINEMKVIMWDMVCADEFHAEMIARDTSLKNQKGNFRLYEQVFAAHKISKDKFYSGLRYYEEHPDEFKVLMDSVQSYGNNVKNKPATIKEVQPSKLQQ